MHNAISRFKELPVTKRIVVASVPIIVILLNVLIVVIAIVNIRPKVSEIIRVVEYNDLSVEIPETNKEALSEQLYYLLVKNFEVPDEAGVATAVIRPETLESETDSGIVNVSFILDVDRFQQSYRAYLAWSEDQKTWLPEDTLVECAEVQLSKYPDVLCYGMYMNSDSIELYLPYFGKIDTGEEYTVKQRYYADGGPYLEIAIDSCGDKKILDAALADVKKWLINNKLDPEKYAFEVPSHYCPGGVF